VKSLDGGLTCDSFLPTYLDCIFPGRRQIKEIKPQIKIKSFEKLKQNRTTTMIIGSKKG
jgi:hypothetical protein